MCSFYAPAQAITTLCGTPWTWAGVWRMEKYQEKCEAEITYNLEVESSLQWGEGDVEVSMEKEYA